MSRHVLVFKGKFLSTLENKGHCFEGCKINFKQMYFVLSLFFGVASVVAQVFGMV